MVVAGAAASLGRWQGQTVVSAEAADHRAHDAALLAVTHLTRLVGIRYLLAAVENAAVFLAICNLPRDLIKSRNRTRAGLVN